MSSSDGGQVNVMTKSGGEAFHGSAFEFIRNEAFNANDFLSNKTPSLAASLGRESNGKLKKKPFPYMSLIGTSKTKTKNKKQSTKNKEQSSSFPFAPP
ncbi:MAG TPA: hypothetical protein VN643_02535 [Pyrinomonadaceae bacterium]|nr:hypothetical protein [Pyrinomonadaceae bacterium]